MILVAISTKTPQIEAKYFSWQIRASYSLLYYPVFNNLHRRKGGDLHGNKEKDKSKNKKEVSW